jgi:hypothetical protein
MRFYMQQLKQQLITDRRTLSTYQAALYVLIDANLTRSELISAVQSQFRTGQLGNAPSNQSLQNAIYKLRITGRLTETNGLLTITDAGLKELKRAAHSSGGVVFFDVRLTRIPFKPRTSKPSASNKFSYLFKLH